MWPRLRGKVSDRKLRLYACACCRMVLPLLGPGEWAQAVVETMEVHADGRATPQELAVAREKVARWSRPRPMLQGIFTYPSVVEVGVELDPNAPGFDGVKASAYYARQAAHAAIGNLVQDNAAGAAEQVERAVVDACTYWPPGSAQAVEMDGDKDWALRSAHRFALADQCSLLREIFLDPYHPVPIPASWLNWQDRTVVQIAQTIYEGRRFDELPILGDTLADAGCDHPEILEHCQSQTPHFRGCWLVDVLLGRE